MVIIWHCFQFHVCPQVGYLGINVTKGPTEPNILNPKKYMQKNTRLEIILSMLLDLAGTLA